MLVSGWIEIGIFVQSNSAYQWMFECDRTLALPLGLQHVSEVFRSGTQDTPVGLEHLTVNHKRHVTVVTLLQKPTMGKAAVSLWKWLWFGFCLCVLIVLTSAGTGRSSLSAWPSLWCACTLWAGGGWGRSALRTDSARHQMCSPHTLLLPQQRCNALTQISVKRMVQFLKKIIKDTK